ncbi:MAG TPA: methyltransferase domain-containing protein, partial [Actinomycetota bacterium]|nr:methyltransferase domain-containing protein [Actinomycetota bacterium]
GRTVLELGAGRGALSLELLIRGASAVTGNDLSSEMVDQARRRIAAAGRADRATFEAGDAAALTLSPHDVVVSDKVFCCYPDAAGLLENSLPAAREVYAFALPASRGPRGLLSRIGIAFENLARRVRRNPFRAYVHSLRRIDARVRRAGFSPVARGRHWLWDVAVYRREAID